MENKGITDASVPVLKEMLKGSFITDFYIHNTSISPAKKDELDALAKIAISNRTVKSVSKDGPVLPAKTKEQIDLIKSGGDSATMSDMCVFFSFMMSTNPSNLNSAKQ
jgi:hypothetical protein